jgi:hypothetical protein
VGARDCPDDGEAEPVTIRVLQHDLPGLRAGSLFQHHIRFAADVQAFLDEAN